MWILTLRSPLGQPSEHILATGPTTLGRNPENDIVVNDDGASRSHAELFVTADSKTVAIRDLGSTNGTFVNRERLARPASLRPGDQIRIGSYTAELTFREQRSAQTRTAVLSGTQPFTRDLLLEAVDYHALAVYEAASRLNGILDLDTALQEVAKLLRAALKADQCAVILDDHFGRLQEYGLPEAIAQQAVSQRSIVNIPDFSAPGGASQAARVSSATPRALLCVPVLLGNEVVALLYLSRFTRAAQPFDERAVRLVVAISHQAALAIQRARLLAQARTALAKSEARYRAIVEDQTELIVRLSPERRLTFVNAAYCRALGLPAEHLVGTPFNPRLLPEEAQYVARKRATLSPEQPAVRYWHRVADSDEPHWQEWTERALYDEHGVLVEYQAVGQDVTTRKLAELALKQRNRELSTMNAVAAAIGRSPSLQSMGSAALAQLVQLMELDGACLHVLAGEPEAGHTLKLVAHANMPPALLPEIEALALRGEPELVPSEVQARLQAAWEAVAGRPAPPVWRVVALQARSKALGVLAVFRHPPGQFSQPDDHLLSALGQQLGIALDNLQLRDTAAEIELLRRLDALRAELIANVSHELRTPLGLITVFCTTLLRDDVSFDPTTQREFLLDIKDEAERLSQIVDNLLDLSRLQQGRLRLDRQPVDLAQHLRRTVAAMQPRLPRHRLVLGLPDVALVAVVDIKRLDQVLRNLLENAVKYSPEGGDIEIRASALDGAVLIEVADQGIGIPRQDLERIFESFYRVENEHTQRIGGVGLGLAICHEIVEAHGGRIWANSTPGAGSTFSLKLPMNGDTHA